MLTDYCGLGDGSCIGTCLLLYLFLVRALETCLVFASSENSFLLTMMFNILYLLEKALEKCGGNLDSAIKSLTDLDSAIKSLTELRLESTIGKFDAVQEANVQAQKPVAITTNGEDASSENPSNTQTAYMNGTEWVELFVREMLSASNMDDARNRASRELEFLEKSICAHATAKTDQGLQQENNVLKEQLQALIQENNILKRAVSIQHQRQKEFEDKSRELHNLKQLVSQYQEQLRTLEVNNYALTLHLKQAQQSNSLPGAFSS